MWCLGGNDTSVKLKGKRSCAKLNCICFNGQLNWSAINQRHGPLNRLGGFLLIREMHCCTDHLFFSGLADNQSELIFSLLNHV